MNITTKYLKENGFSEENRGGKIFYRYANIVVTWDPVYNWMICDPINYSVTGYITSISELERLMDGSGDKDLP